MGFSAFASEQAQASQPEPEAAEFPGSVRTVAAIGRRLPLAALCVVLGGAAARADCLPGEAEVFACQMQGGRKAVSLCASDNRLTYRFGAPSQRPELTLSRDYTQVVARPWNGIGRTIWESVSFSNRGYVYELGMGVDKIDAVEGRPAAGGAVRVSQDGRDLADLPCDEGTAGYQGFALEDAYRAAGYCWDYSKGQWHRACE